MPLPTLFISHGSPMFAVEPGRLGPQLAALGRALPRPRAVLVMSPHWMSRGVEVQAIAMPPTIHDFGGFPPLLYTLSYPAAGAPAVAEDVAARLAAAGIPARITANGGLDHGAWVPLRHLYPQADVPVLQISLSMPAHPRDLLDLGRALATLPAEDVLVVGSGSLTHNLHDLRATAVPAGYAEAFAEWVWRTLAKGDVDALLAYREEAPHGARAHPSEEHFLPLFFALGAAGEAWHRVTRLDGGIDHGVLSMDSFVFGEAAAAASAH